MRNPQGDPVKGTICTIMAVVTLSYLAWLMWSPLNFFLGSAIAGVPSVPAIIVDTIVFIPIMYVLIRKWLRTMVKRKSGPAAGIDVVERGRAAPEPGDEWGTATRPYDGGPPSRIMGPKSDIRDTPDLDSSFYVKLPDLDTGEVLFDPRDLMTRAMIRSTVSSGGWVHKSVSSRAMGSLKSSESEEHGRPTRWRIPGPEVHSIHLPSTVVAAIARGERPSETGHLTIRREDIRESVFTGRVPLTVLMVVDVSMSMKGCMREVRDVIGRIERETRGSKDRVGIIAFKDSGAVEVQAPTTNWNKVYRALARLRVSGLTPLAEALMKALEVVRRERMRSRDVQPLVVLISDFAPNIPLAQSVGPGHEQYTPVKDLVKAARLLRRSKVRIAAVNVNPHERHWCTLLHRPYYEALELATTLRARRDGLADPIEAVLAVPALRKTFGAFLVARAGGGRCYLYREVMAARSAIGLFLAGCQTRSRLSMDDLHEAEAYLSH